MSKIPYILAAIDANLTKILYKLFFRSFFAKYDGLVPIFYLLHFNTLESRSYNKLQLIE